MTLTRHAAFAAPLAIAPFHPAEAEADPVLPPYRRWRAALAEWNRLARQPEHDTLATPQVIALQNDAEQALDELRGLAPKTNEGLAALLHVFWAEYGPDALPGTEIYEREHRERGFPLIEAIWRAADPESARREIGVALNVR